MIHDLLVSPEDFSKHINRSTASFSAIALYGQRATTHDDFWATVSQSLPNHGRGITKFSRLSGPETDSDNTVEQSYKPWHLSPIGAIPHLQIDTQRVELCPYPCRGELSLQHRSMD
jgi:hypothetical protein